MHNDDGDLQFYLEDLRFPDSIAASKALAHILDGNKIYRNRACLCGSGKKLKKCHLAELEFMTSLPRPIIAKDFMLFMKTHMELEIMKKSHELIKMLALFHLLAEENKAA
jgi:hypothetical protein